MDVGTGGTGGHFSKTRPKCPFSCNLVALLDNTENAKMNSKTRVSGDFRRSKFQNFPADHAPRTPVSGFHCFITRLSSQSQSKNPANMPLNLCSPHFYNASYVPECKSAESLKLHQDLEFLCIRVTAIR